MINTIHLDTIYEIIRHLKLCDIMRFIRSNKRLISMKDYDGWNNIFVKYLADEFSLSIDPETCKTLCKKYSLLCNFITTNTNIHDLGGGCSKFSSKNGCLQITTYDQYQHTSEIIIDDIEITTEKHVFNDPIHYISRPNVIYDNIIGWNNITIIIETNTKFDPINLHLTISTSNGQLIYNINGQTIYGYYDMEGRIFNEQHAVQYINNKWRLTLTLFTDLCSCLVWTSQEDIILHDHSVYDGVVVNRYIEIDRITSRKFVLDMFPDYCTNRLIPSIYCYMEYYETSNSTIIELDETQFLKTFYIEFMSDDHYFSSLIITIKTCSKYAYKYTHDDQHTIVFDRKELRIVTPRVYILQLFANTYENLSTLYRYEYKLELDNCRQVPRVCYQRKSCYRTFDGQGGFGYSC